MCTGQKCRRCGCTDDDCRICIERQGYPCHWVDRDLCSACYRPHDCVPRPRSRKYKPNSRWEKRLHRFPDSYWICGEYSVRDESHLHHIASRSKLRLTELKAKINLAARGYSKGDLPF